MQAGEARAGTAREAEQGQYRGPPDQSRGSGAREAANPKQDRREPGVGTDTGSPFQPPAG